MKKSGFIAGLICVAIAVMTGGCAKKTDVVRLSYSIDSIKTNVYVSDTGNTYWPLKISFLSGDPQELLTLKVIGLPINLSVTPDSITANPTFTEDFVFRAVNVIHGTYPCSLTAYSPTTGTRTYAFNLVVVTANCATAMAGNYSGSSACIYANYPYTALVTALGGDSVNIQGFGGYGTSSNIRAYFNCGVDSVTIPSQYDGNGDTIMGAGTFTANAMTIAYTKKTATGGYDNCVATLAKQ